MISKKELIDAISMSRPRRVSQNSFSEPYELKFERDTRGFDNLFAAVHFERRFSMTFNRMVTTTEGEQNDAELEAMIKKGMAASIHGSLYSEITYDICKSRYEIEMGGTREAAIKILDRLLDKIEGTEHDYNM